LSERHHLCLANHPPPDDPEQSKRFIDTAKETGTDESREGFECVFENVVPPKLPAAPDRTKR
jgi:hypothetical protein